MNNEISVSVMGFAGADAVLIENEGKKPYAYFRVGSTPWRGAGDVREQVTEWFTVRTYGELARNCAVSVRKGTPLLVRGRLETDTYQLKDDPTQMRKDLIIRADSVGVELGRGTATYTKNLPVEEESDPF
ncbi:single-stranded DNA-binding protein [Flaviflexus huanghaiensis]|uniref:single-stranded DNA-binding protein n=1 Tax=Flaviflexus huanghaiensis TaxID=1111473 RepID=UPI0015F9ED8B|nr:single-stranded DNA-binding protein [Flaviflexus huanghaiensis]